MRSNSVESSLSKSNVIFVYTGNVGSSPMVQALSKCRHVFSPYHEQLDFRNLTEDTRPSDEAVRRAFKERISILSSRPNNFRVSIAKWRPFVLKQAYGLQREDLKSFSSVLICRKYLLHQAVKITLNESVLGTRWPQFLKGDQAEEALALVKDFNRPLNRVERKRALKIHRDLLKRTELTISNSKLIFEERFGRKVITEDFLSPDLSHEKIEKLSKALFDRDDLVGDHFAETSLVSSSKKIGFSMGQVTDLSDLWASKSVRDVEERYQEAIGSLETLRL